MFENKNRVHMEEKGAASLLAEIIYTYITSLNYHTRQEILITCIGTDRSTGDSLGPLTGTLLQDENYLPAQVIGCLDHPVHASNLKEIISQIEKDYLHPFIIAIDAGLGKQNSVGYIDVKKGPLQPGTGVNKNLTEIGDMHITGLVNIGGYMEYLVLQSTRLSLVMNMAGIISRALKNSFLKLEKHENYKNRA
ncbi:MAG: spore protease YyaC [Halanaerobiaceae bacterium]